MCMEFNKKVKDLDFKCTIKAFKFFLREMSEEKKLEISNLIDLQEGLIDIPKMEETFKKVLIDFYTENMPLRPRLDKYIEECETFTLGFSNDPFGYIAELLTGAFRLLPKYIYAGVVFKRVDANKGETYIEVKLEMGSESKEKK